ncbi:hypothetical protein KQR56_09900 [Bacillus velezensis]|nr:hypothetical protein [Bacillus velezensis]
MQSEEENEQKIIVKGLRKENNLHQSCQDLADQLHESRQNEALLRKYLKTEEQKNEKLQLQIEKLAKKNKYLKNSLLVHRMQLTASTSGGDRSNDIGVFKITAYTAGVESTGKRPGDEGYGITADGSMVQEGITVAAGSCCHTVRNCRLYRWNRQADSTGHRRRS